MGLGDVTGTGASGRLVFGQDGLGVEPFGDDLIGCRGLQRTGSMIGLLGLTLRVSTHDPEPPGGKLGDAAAAATD